MVMEGLRKFNELLNNLFTVVGGVTLFLMMAVACVNMVLRLMGMPISAAFELVGFLGALTVSLPLGYAQIKKSHIAVDILSSKFPPDLRKVLTAISLVLAMAFFFVAAWQVGGHAETLRRSGEVSETLRIPFYPFTYGVAASCGLMTFCLFTDLLLLLVPPKKTDR
jgi:TRAP-type C4-dicarboxylate transport system permease small subunit